MPEFEEVLGEAKALKPQLDVVAAQMSIGVALHEAAEQKRLEYKAAQRDYEAAQNEVAENSEEIQELGSGLALVARYNKKLSVISRASLLLALNYSGIDNRFSDPSVRPVEETLEHLRTEFNSINGNLESLETLASEEGHPVLYCQAIGGTSYLGIGGRVEHPSAEYFFTAQTVGDGLAIEFASFDDVLGDEVRATFSVHKTSDFNIKNFVSGHQDKRLGFDRIKMRSAADVAATADRAELILGRSLTSMQKNPFFVGEAACKAAVSFLQENMLRIDCDVPDLFETA